MFVVEQGVGGELFAGLPDAGPGFGVYIHWPFCAQKCPYCDFNSHVRFGGWDEARFLAAYKCELDFVAGLTGPRDVRSIFFGGGTPSLMQPATTAEIIDHIAKLWSVAPDAEITLEANPGSVEAGRFKGYRAAGVNRVSMGLQSLRDDDLKKLGRIHTVAESKAALAIARDTFERFSFDLIYARPGQRANAWRSELAEALDLAGDHLSLYQLTIEPDTPYAALHAAGKLVVPDAEAALALWEITQELTEARGFGAYEISNHARPGEESQHNLLYWRYGEYAGVGPGAHGRLVVDDSSSPLEGEAGRGGIRDRSESPHRSYRDYPHPQPLPTRGRGVVQRYATVTERNPEAWCARVEENGQGFTERTELSRSEQADEMLLMGLRLREGVDLDRLATLGGVRPDAAVIDQLVSLGLVETGEGAFAAAKATGNWRADELEPIAACAGPGLAPDTRACLPAGLASSRIRVTPRGRFVLNAVVAELSKSFAAIAPR